uniref:KIAA1549 like n=1 Tax=Callithrix jacchus TaxID=9483 RepID=A0A5F4WA02_CALJA
MAPQEAKPQGSREAGPAARGRRGRLVARGLGRAGWGAARCTGVKGPGAGASHDAPPRLPTLLLGLLLLATLLEHGQADLGTDNLQVNVTRTPESFPPGKLLPISPTWPFTEVRSSSAADRIKTVLGQPSDNTSLPQSARTPASKTHHTTRAHMDFSSSLYQGSGHSASLEPSKDSTESLVQPGPRRGQEAADASAPENSRGPALSAEHTSSSLVPSPPHVTAPGREQAILSGAVPASPSTGTADFPSILTFLQPTENHASPSPVPEMSTPPAEGSDGSPPTAARDLLLSSRVPHLLSTSWTFPRWKKDSMTAILRKNEEANVTIPLQAFPRKEVLSLHTVNGFVSDFSTHRVSSPIITAPRTNSLPSGSPPPSMLSVQATQTVSPSLGFSNTKPESYAAAVAHSGLPASASRQVKTSLSSMDVYDSSTMGDMKKPTTTDVFWSSLSADPGSLSTESIISGLQQQTNYDLNGHTVSSTSWETHLAPTAPPSGLTSAANAIKSQDFRATAGHSVTGEGFSTEDLILGTSTEQPVQESDMTVVGSHRDLWPLSNNNHSIDFQTAEVEYDSSTSQHSVSHPQPQLPDQPTHPLFLTLSRPTSTDGLQEMLSDGTDTGSEISSDINLSRERNTSRPFQNILRYHSAAESSLSASVFPKTSSRVLRASQHPKKWTGAATNAVDTVSSKVEPTAATAVTLFLRKSSPPALSAALVAKGTSPSPLAVASGPAKSSSMTTLAKNVTNKAASVPKRTPGAIHTAFPFTPTYMYARTAHTMSTHTAMQGNMGTASGLLSTTYLPRKPQAMHTGLPNPTNPEMPRASTPRPLTVTAALTSIAASVKATRLPPLRAENTDAALPAASAAVVTTGKMASNLECQMSSKLLVKTVLQFVSQADNIQSCRFAQTMEQRLQKAFQDAERRVLNTRSNLTIQIVSTSNASQAVTLVYVVGNQSTFLNGTVASSLLTQLSAELVGFYLTYPPLTIAEPLEYPNLDISETTRDYWVITVLQGVDNSLVGLHNQSFARLMEQRLAQLFMMSQQQGRRFKRATTLGSYTVQMVKMQRVPGPKDPAELTYYTLYNGKPLLGTAAAKILSTIDSQRMALTLHHVVLLQADPVVKNPPNNLWIIAAVLAPIAVVTVIIIIITAVLCRKNKNDFKPDTMINLPQRAKPVQGFDYAKQHLGQQGADEEVIPVTQETVVLPLPIRDAPQERDVAQDGSTIKTAKSTETRKSRSPSENGSVISNESGKPSSGRRSPQNVMAQQKVTKEEARKRNVPASDEEEGAVLFDNSSKVAAEPFDTSSGSVQLIAIKPTALPVVPPTSDRSQESSAVLNGEVNKALKQKSDIEHYRNKLRLKAKRKGYYDFPAVETSKGLTERKKMYEKAPKEMEHVLDPDSELCAPFAESKNRQQMKNSVYRSRQSLNSPSPGETEMDLLVTRERPRRGIRNSGYDTEPEIIEETNIDRVHEPRGYSRSRQVKGHSETSTLSSQPSIDEVRQQMHMLLEEAFSLASAGHAGQSRHQEAYGSAQHLPYSEVVTSAPGTMTRPRAGVQWVPTYRPEMYQYSLPRPAYRFSQLPEMVMGSPPPPVPPRTGPVAVASLRRSTSDIGSKTRMSESAGPEPTQLHDSASFTQMSRGPVSVAQLDQSALNYSGNTVPAVFAIPAANRPGFTGYFIPTPPSSYRNQAWMSYAGENELPSQWADSVPLPGYIEAYPRSRYPQSSPSRLPRQYSQPANLHPSLEQAPTPSAAASQQSLAENDPSDAPLTNISTAALVKAIREEVAKLAKKQTDMFEFQV